MSHNIAPGGGGGHSRHAETVLHLFYLRELMLQTHRVITLSDNDWLPLPVGSFTVLKYSPLSQPIHMHSGVMVEDE